MTVRYDSVPIKRLYLDPNTGFLNARNVPIARVGVFPYIRKDGAVVKEAKLPEDLLSDATVDSANGKPITDNHPQGLVNRNNAKDLMKGLTANNAHVEGDKLKVDLTITDPQLIKEVNDGKQELSIGFSTEVSPEQGTFNGAKYDCAQKNIQINHVAVVQRGRAGHSVRLTGDSAEMVLDESEEQNSMEFTQVRLDGENVKVANEDVDRVMKLDADNDAKAKQIAQYKAQIKKLQEQIKALEGNADDSKKSKDEAEAKADALEKELADYKSKYEGDAFDKALDEKMELINTVKPYVGDSYDFKGKSIKDMKADAIKSVNDSVDLEGKSDDYINAYFDSMLENHKPSSVVGYTGTEVKGDSMDSLEAEALAARNAIYNVDSYK